MTLLVLGLARPSVAAEPTKPLIEQPTSEYKARRKALMERIKAADIGGMLARPRGGDGAAEGSRRGVGAGGRRRRRDRGARGRPLPPAQ